MAARYFRLQIRNAADTADALVLSSYPADTYPYLTGPPSGDGQKLDPATGGVDIGAYTVQAADAGSVITAALVDGDGRQTLAHRRAYIRQSIDGVTWTTVLLAGYVNGYRLVDAITWEFTIGESQRVEQMRRVFDRTSTNFDKVTCLFGGPVKGGWGPLRDYGGWVFKVTAVDANLVTLQFVEGFIPVTDVVALWGWARNALSDWSRERVNRVIFNDPKTIINGITVFDDLTVEIQQLDGTLVDRFTPALQVELNVRLFDFSGVVTKLDKLQVLRVDTPWQASPPSVNDEFRLYLWREVISEENPLHIDAHPVDVVTALWTDAGIPYDTTAAASVRAALGDRTRLTLRITQGYQLQDFLQDVIFGAFGIAARRGTDGEMELYVARVRNLAAPSNTYDLTDLRNPNTVIFELDEGTIYNTVIVEQEVYAPWSPSSGHPRATDDIIPVKITAVVELDSDGDGTPDSATEGPRELRFTIPGCVRLAESGFDELPLFIAQGIAAEVFDRFGKGGVFGNLEALPDLTELTGQELILNVAHLPNAGVRGGARVLQVVQRTETPAGPAIRLLDSGPNSQFATSPTFSLAANAGKPKKVVDVTVTNQGALQTAEAWLRVEWSVAASQPTGNGSLLVTYQPADLPAAFQLPAVDAGSRVWVRMQTFRPGMRATAWTAWQNVDLANLTAPSALAQVQDPTDDGITEVSWTLGESEIPVEVYQRPQGDPAGEARLVDLLAAGSDRLRLKLAPGSSFTIGVRHREASPFAGVSATTELSFTVAGSIPTLAAPTISAFSIVKNRDIELFNWFPLDTEAVIGVCLRAAVLPSYYEIEMATETAIGSGTPGSYSLVQTLAASVEDSEYRTTQPIDGKYRYFRVRHIREGANPSGYSDVVSALPGWSQACDLPVPSFDIEPGEMQVGRYDFIGALASDPVITARVSGDTLARLSIRADGMMEWGPGGAAALDTNLYRSAANTLRTDDALIVAGLLSPLAGIALTGTLLIGGDANLYRNAANELKTDDALVVAGLLTAQAGLTMSSGDLLVQSGATRTVRIGGTISGGNIEIQESVGGGWTYALRAKGSAGAALGGFGFLGTADALVYYYIGLAYDSTTNVRFTNAAVTPGSSGGLTLGTVSLPWGAAYMGALTATTGTFSGDLNANSGIVQVNGGTPQLRLSETDQGAGLKNWTLEVGTQVLRIRTRDDAWGALAIPLGLTRAGAMTLLGGLTATTVTATGLIQATVTTQQLALRYDASNHLAVTVGATGAVTYNATGAGALHTFSDDLTIGSLQPFDAASSPDLDDVFRFNGTKWVPSALTYRFTDGDVVAEAYTDGSASAHVHDGRTLTGAIGATPSAPTVTAGYHSTVVNLGGVPPANVEWQIRWSTDGGTNWSDALALGLIHTTGDQVVHGQLDPALTYLYQVRKVGSTTGSFSASSTGVQPSNTPRVNPFDVALFSQVATVDLASLSASLGDITAGRIRNASGAHGTHGILVSGLMSDVPNWTRFLNLVDETDNFIEHERFKVHHDGTVIISNGTQTLFTVTAAGTSAYWQNTGATVGINVQGTLPGGWTRYVNLGGSGTDYFLYSESGRFRVRHNGEILMFGATNQMFELASNGSAFWLANNGDTAGILIQGGNESWWTRYINVGGGTAFLKHDKLELLYDGTAIFRGVAQETDSSPKFKIDFPNKLLTVIDEQGSPITRASFGKFGAGAAYGIRLFDENGTILIDTTTTQFAGANLLGNTVLAGSLRAYLTQDNTNTGTQNDVALNSDTIVFRWAGASASTITGFTGGARGRVLMILATSVGLTLANDNGGSSTGNRIYTGTGANVTLGQNGSGAILWWDDNNNHWNVIARSN